MQWIKVVIGAAIVSTLSALLIFGLLTYRDAGRLFAPNVVIVTPLYDDAALFFSQAEIERFYATYPAYEISTIATGSAIISTPTMQVRASVFYASSPFFSVHFVDIIEGTNPQDGTNSVLLSELLAWRLFGGFNVVGVTVRIFDEPFVVSGVAAGGDVGYVAWLPRIAAQGMAIQSIFIRFPNYCQVSAFAVPREMLGFRSHDDYMILDINRFMEAINIRNRLVLYVLWLVGLAWSVGSLLKILQAKEKRFAMREYSELAFKLGFAVLSIYVLVTGVSGIIYALPNLSYENASLFGFILGWVDMPPDEFLLPNIERLFELNSRANFIFLGNLVTVAISLCLLVYCQRVGSFCYTDERKHLP